MKLLKTAEFESHVRAIVVDGRYLVLDWKDCRPSYGELAFLGSIFLKVPWLGLTAIATKTLTAEIIESLSMFNPAEIFANPDRPNIYFSSSAGRDRGDDKLDDILRPMVDRLKREKL